MTFKVVTKNGDEGLTNVGSFRLLKNSDEVEAIGAIDEIDSFLGYIVSCDENMRKDHNSIREALYEIMADIHLGNHSKYDEETRLHPVSEAIVHLHKELEPLDISTFVRLIGPYNIFRTLTRRAERRTVALLATRPYLQPHVKFLNRLSDYWYLLALMDTMEGGKPKPIMVN